MGNKIDFISAREKKIETEARKELRRIKAKYPNVTINEKQLSQIIQGVENEGKNHKKR